MVPFLPSHIALSCLMLANTSLEVRPALPRLVQGFVVPAERELLGQCLALVHKLWVDAPRAKLQAVRLKYERTRHHKVSCMAPPPMPPLF